MTASGETAETEAFVMGRSYVEDASEDWMSPTARSRWFCRLSMATDEV